MKIQGLFKKIFHSKKIIKIKIKYRLILKENKNTVSMYLVFIRGLRINLILETEV